jgi:superfamily II DNA or RNA helicase
MPNLRDYAWKRKYDSDERSLIDRFYVPALECAQRYDRTTGYFQARVFTLAARGIEGLLRNDGRMRLVVGCTLDPPEVAAIERGETLRGVLEARLGAMPLAPEGASEAEALELLSWMVARGFLEVRAAVPCDERRHPIAGTAIFHEKCGIVEDKTGDRIAFSGSLNETPAGWSGNWESFHVFTDWDGTREHVDEEERSFAELWANRKPRCLVVDVPEAARADLLRFLPREGELPRRLQGSDVVSVATPPARGQVEPPSASEPPRLDVEELRRRVWALIHHGPALPSGARVGEATSIVTPWPHQVRAFERMWSAWPPKLLIADEVGLGKTIEAGLLLRQAWLAGRAKRILVLAPKAVLEQWQIELREKFNLNWPIYDGQKLCWYPSPALDGATERKVSRAEWHRESFVIASSHLMRRADRARDLLEDAAPWDLVVLDEAHHARRKGAGDTRDRGPNRLLSLMQRLRERTQGLVLLTATPMQIDPIEVWDLLALLGLPPEWTPDAFTSFFDRAAAANPSHEDFEILARLFRAVERTYGPTPDAAAERVAPRGSRLAARTILDALRDQAVTARRRLEADKRSAALALMRANTPVSRLVSRHTRELLRRYFAAGKIGTPIATRSVEDRFVALSAAERTVYEAVEDYISTTWQRAAQAEKNAVGFVMTIYRRRLASSFAALRCTLEARLAALASDAGSQPTFGVLREDVSDDEASDDDPMDEDEAERFERAALDAEERDAVAGLLAAIRTLPTDTKARLLGDALRDLREAGFPQAIVFTQYTDTLEFLRDLLAREGLRILCFSGRGGEGVSRDGAWRSISRDETKRMFREGAADVLLCTDAAAEGLNFQFCGALVNYDMPWNPMRVEQRIGRIDRLGQRFETISIVNLHYEDTVETDVYMALRQRIGLFERFVGRLQPILAQVSRRIRDAALAGREERGRTRAEAASFVDAGVRETEESTFDLDDAAAADLDAAERPPALYDLPTLDLLLRRPELLPPGVEIKQLGPSGEYEYSQPGMRKRIRVTTNPDLYDDHPGSLELWSPGSPSFPAADGEGSASEVRDGVSLGDLLS